MSTALNIRKEIQALLNVPQDGKLGPNSLLALHQLVNTPDGTGWPVSIEATAPASPVQHSVIASDFADSSDLAAYNKAIAEGYNEAYALKVGDNCVGCWGDPTGDVNGVPMCALPPEDWKARWGAGDAARGKIVLVTSGNQIVAHELRDTMPHLSNITNGAGIDLNPASLRAFGLEAPIMHRVLWEWEDQTTPSPA